MRIHILNILTTPGKNVINFYLSYSSLGRNLIPLPLLRIDLLLFETAQGDVIVRLSVIGLVLQQQLLRWYLSGKESSPWCPEGWDGF